MQRPRDRHPAPHWSDDDAAAAWTAFLNRAIPSDADRPTLPADADLAPVRSAYEYFSTLGQLQKASLSDVMRHGRAIYDNPARGFYPLLFPDKTRRELVQDATAFRAAGVSYGVRAVGDGRELFVRNQFGVELLAVELDANGQPNWWRLRVLGLATHEFLALGPEQPRHLQRIVNSRWFQQAGVLRTAPLDAAFPAQMHAAVRALAAIPVFLATMSVNGCGPEGIPDFVPDLQYKECCDKHDVCYARGGTELDRARCDENLARCIEALGGMGLTATLYWIFVTFFGVLAFNYRERPAGAAPVNCTRVTQGQGGGPNCSYVIRLRDVSVTGADPDGQVLELEIVPDFDRQIRTNPGLLRKLRFPGQTVSGDRTLRFGTNPLTVKFGETSCGSTVDVQLKMTDESSTLGSSQWIRFVCDGSTWSAALTISVPPAQVTFNYEITTTCA